MSQRLIAVEEHFILPELLEAGLRYLASPAPSVSMQKRTGGDVRCRLPF
jgi:hypothetical protein